MCIATHLEASYLDETIGCTGSGDSLDCAGYGIGGTSFPLDTDICKVDEESGKPIVFP